MSGVVKVERVGSVQVMTLRRETRRNAIDAELSQALAAAVGVLEADPSLRCGVLTGAGGHFSSGMDLKAHAAGESIEISGQGIGGITKRRSHKPIVAAVEGYALAGGFELVLACDLVVAAESASFGIPEVKRGLIAGSGGLFRLASRLPSAMAAELALTGRTVGTEEAARWGLVNRVVPDGEALEAALTLADSISVNSPVAVHASRQLLDAQDSSTALWSFQDEVLAQVMGSDDAREGEAAFLERREPRWPGR